MERKKITIELQSDGWVIWFGNLRYAWNHNAEDLGTQALEVLFMDMGYEVETKDGF